MRSARVLSWTRATAALVALSFSALWFSVFPTAAQEPGREIFTETASPACALCHTLANAEATGEIGPNLDELKPDEERVRRAVKNGVGNMPPYGETLSDEQIAAVSRYVAKVTGAVASP